MTKSIQNLLSHLPDFITVYKTHIEKRIVIGTQDGSEIFEAMQKSDKTKYLASVLERRIKYYTDSGFIVSPTDRRC